MASSLEEEADEDAFKSSARQHVHQLLCTDLLNGTCKCHAIVTEALDAIQTEWKCRQPQTNMGNTTKQLSMSCVEQLVQKQNSECMVRSYGCMSSFLDGDEQHQNLNQEVLIGYLSTVSHKGERTGQLYLKDHTGTIVCQVSNCNMDWLGRFVILYCWNYISRRKEGSYIETCCQCSPLLIPLSNDLAGITGWSAIVDKGFPQDGALDVEDVLQLFIDRSKIDASKDLSAHVTLTGIVAAKSTLYRVRNSPFFFFELASDNKVSKVPVLAKGVDTAYLHHFVHIGQICTVTRLLPTTINKGTTSSYPVLLCTSRTRISGGETNTMLQSPTVSGVITDCISKEAGIYELNGKVRLYLCYLYDGSKHHPQYRTGTNITIYNAHDYMLGKLPQRCIICCMRSTVVIIKHSQIALSQVKLSNSAENSLLYLILKLNPSPSRLHWLCIVWPRLQQNLGQLVCRPEHNSAMWKIMTSASTTSGHSWIAPRKRNVYEEFLDHSVHPCVATKDPSVAAKDSIMAAKDLCVAPTDPCVAPIDPCVASKDPCLAPTDLCVASKDPCVAPTDHCVAPTDPCLAPTDPCVASTDPCVAPTDPRVAPTDPCVAPTDPCVAPTDPRVTLTDQYVAPKVPYTAAKVQCVATKDSMDEGIYVQFSSINDLCNQFTSTSRALSCSRNISDTKNWKCRTIASTDLQPPMILIGHLESSSQTGQLQLHDKTGYIQCLVTNIQNMETKLCDFHDNNSVSSQHILPSALNQVIRIDQFLVVKEEFAHCDAAPADGDEASQMAGDASSVQTDSIITDSTNEDAITTKYGREDWTRVYVVFSMKEMVVCGKMDMEVSKPIKRTASFAGLKQTDSAVMRKQKPNVSTRALFVVENKGGLHQDSITASKQYSFFVNIVLLDCPLFNSEVNGNMVQVKLGGESQVASKHVTLCFSRNAVSWFPVLYSGCVYSLSLDESCPDGAVLRASVKSTKGYLYKQIVRSGCPQVMQVAPSAKLTEVQENELPSEIQTECRKLRANMLSNYTVYSIRQLMQTESGPYDNIVSFWGRIVSCNYVPTKYARSTHLMQPGWQMKLLVQETQSGSDDESIVQVYMNVSPLIYPFGLVPGSSVIFRRCMKVKSSKGNISYQVGALTDITIQHMPYGVLDKVHEVSEGIHHQSFPQYFLAQLSNNQVIPEPRCDFTIACHIQAIHLLVLRWSCDKCGHSECICPSTSCDVYRQGKITAQAKFIVDDGTGEATVWCHDEGAVPTLLGLTSSVWKAFRELLPHYGKVVYKYNREEQPQWQEASPLPQLSDNVESVMGMLCRHSSIQQPIRMKCRMLPSNRQTRKQTYPQGTYVSTDAAGHNCPSTKYVPWLHIKCTKLTPK